MKCRPQRKTGFSLIELVVVIAILAVLASIVFPAFARARESSRRASCMGNLKQLGLAFTQYAQDNNGRLPSATFGLMGGGKAGGWTFYNTFGSITPGNFDPSKGGIAPYVKSPEVFVCPSDSEGRLIGQSYSVNSCTTSFDSSARGIVSAKTIASFDKPSKWMLLNEESAAGGKLDDAAGSTKDGFFAQQNSDNFSRRHLDGSNLLFLDGHVKWFFPSEARADGYAVGGTHAADRGDACP